MNLPLVASPLRACARHGRSSGTSSLRRQAWSRGPQPPAHASKAPPARLGGPCAGTLASASPVSCAANEAERSGLLKCQISGTSHIQPAGTDVLAGDTIPAMFWNAVNSRGPRVWMRQKELGIWRSWTWDQTAEAVREIAGGLMSLGFAPGECASVLSNTNIEWVLADLAVLSCGGVSNGIYPTDAAAQVHYLSEDSRTTVLFVEDDEQLDKALEVRSSLPLLRKIVVFDMEGLRGLDDPHVLSLQALRELGRTFNQQHPDAITQRVQGCKADDVAILVYTSGTTGKPKGAMHTHAALTYTVRGYNTLISRSEDDETMCFLPLCHIAERMGGEYFSLYTGAKLNFVENPDTVPENVREIAPTVFTAVPRVWEKFYSGVMIALEGIHTHAAGSLCLVHRRRHAHCRLGTRRPARGRRAQASVSGCALAGAEQRAQAHRHSSCAFPRYWRGTHLTRTGEVVPGVGRSHAGGMGHDGDLRRRHRRARQPHQARLHRPGGHLQRSTRGPSDRRDPRARPQRLQGLPEPAGKNRRNDRPRRLAAHRRRGPDRRRRLPAHHRPHEGHHHHGRAARTSRPASWRTSSSSAPT